MARTGRRPGPSTTRAEVLEAARDLFATHGYEATTIRMVAEAAKVDPALVVRHFHGKERLFLAAVEWPFDPDEVIPRLASGPKSRAGYRIVQFFLQTWEDPAQRAPVLALLRSATSSEPARALLRDLVGRKVLVPFVTACGFDQPELRGVLLGTQLLGLGMLRHVLAFEPLATMERARLVEIVGAAVQRTLTAKLP